MFEMHCKWRSCFYLIVAMSTCTEAATRFRAGPNNRFYDNDNRVGAIGSRLWATYGGGGSCLLSGTSRSNNVQDTIKAVACKGMQVVMFRGVNLAGRVKTPPFTPFADLSTMDSLANVGANVARVPFIWEAYEPTRGQYNASYLHYYKGVIEVGDMSFPTFP
jgi:hypothetical protein